MIYKEFQGEKLSALGFGAMRLPLVSGEADAPVDEQLVHEMVDYAMSHGINYFDTAYPYHGGTSELILGRALSRYPRESYNLATKFPGHQISSSYNPEEVFEDQLKKCGVEYFDFYLLHNIYEKSIHTYLDPRWGIVDYFVEQKKKGRIRHLGFSSHAGLECLTEFLDRYGEEMEFCQIQLNYMDWTLQQGKEKYELLTSRGLDVWVMEPVRGGKLAALKAEDEETLQRLRPGKSMASWAFRFLQKLPRVTMILSGMSDMEQMKDNVETFREEVPLNGEEGETLLRIAEGMKNSIPCMGCRYCCDGCPQGLNIPDLLSAYNELRFAPAINIAMRVEALPEDKRPSACVGCGKCAAVCPQGIKVPEELKGFAEELAKLPSWEAVCRKRDEEQRRLKGR